MTQPIRKEHYNKSYKILAQSFGLMVCMFFLFFIAGEGIPELVKGKGDDFLTILPMMAIPIIGYFVTWFKEKAGALILVGGGVILLIYFLITGEIKMSLVYGLPFILTGILFLIHIKKRKELKSNK